MYIYKYICAIDLGCWTRLISSLAQYPSPVSSPKVVSMDSQVTLSPSFSRHTGDGNPPQGGRFR